MLTIHSLPFQERQFFTEASDERNFVMKGEYYTLEDDVSPEDAKQLFDQMAGLEDIKKNFGELEETCDRRVLFRRAVRLANAGDGKANVVDVTPSRGNAILQGPPGVGKSTVAKVIAISLAARALVPEPRIGFVKAISLRAHYVGRTDKVVDAFLESVRGGVGIIDEIDNVSEGSTSFDREAINALNVSMEAANNQGTRVLMTGQVRGIQRLLNDYPSLRGRFPTVFTIPGFDYAQAKAALEAKVKLEGLTLDPSAAAFACEQLGTAIKIQSERFTNGRAIEEFVEMMLDNHAAKFDLNDLRNKNQKYKAPPGLLIITQESVPIFDMRDSRMKGPRERIEGSLGSGNVAQLRK